MTKLHLGCGQTYFEGYINIDFPFTAQTVQKNIKADKHQNLIRLAYPDNSIEEIRLHHVFEHFTRPVALALLCRWRSFLKPGGLLRIETPDAEACFGLMTSDGISFEHKQQIMRHLFGSHEARWAAHLDGWYKEKFVFVLTKLGFCNLNFETNQHGLLHNIEVSAYKSADEYKFRDYYGAVHEILMLSSVRANQDKTEKLTGSESDMLKIWEKEWKKIYKLSG